jgi:hypothetical protein
MLTRNWPEAGLVNGSRGVVAAFSGAEGVVVRFEGGVERLILPISFFHATRAGAGGGAVLPDAGGSAALASATQPSPTAAHRARIKI